MSLYRDMLRTELQRTVTRVQLATLREVCARSGCTVSTLAGRLGLALNAAHGRLYTLEARGWVELRGRQAGPKATVTVHATLEGRSVVGLLG